MGMEEVVYAMEAIGEAGGWNIVGQFTLNTVFGGVVLLAYGTEEQKEKYPPGIASRDIY